jgi:opacity protein-like surface antigen
MVEHPRRGGSRQRGEGAGVDMKAAVLCSMVVAVTMLSGAAWGALAPEQAERAARQATPSPDRALVYVFRADTGEAAEIWLDGQQAGRLDPRTFMLLSVSGGRHVLRLGRAGGGIAITVDAGRAYYVEQSRAGLRWVPSAQGRPAIQDFRLVEDAFGFSRTLVKKPPPAAPAPTPPAKPRKPPAAAAPPPPARAPVTRPARGAVAVILKSGAFELSEEDQDFLGAQTTYTTSSDGELGIEVEWRHSSGFAVGGEYLRYRNDLENVLGASGTAKTDAFMVNGKKYFEIARVFQPYVGVGLGAVTTSLSDDFSGSGGGFGYQFMAGVEFRFDRVGIYTEFKNVYAKPEDSDGEQMNVGGSGLFVGVSFAFPL